MPKFHEIYCETDFENLTNSLITCVCPLSNTPCDGGGIDIKQQLKVST